MRLTKGKAGNRWLRGLLGPVQCLAWPDAAGQREWLAGHRALCGWRLVARGSGACSAARRQKTVPWSNALFPPMVSFRARGQIDFEEQIGCVATRMSRPTLSAEIGLARPPAATCGIRQSRIEGFKLQSLLPVLARGCLEKQRAAGGGGQGWGGKRVVVPVPGQ
jgi:hypothetical protein